MAYYYSARMLILNYRPTEDMYIAGIVFCVVLC